MSAAEWIDEIRDMVRRRIGVILRVSFLGVVASFLFALSQQHSYTSRAVLQVETSKVADDLVPEVTPGATARQLQLVEQQIMSQGNVRALAQELGLWDDLGGLTETEKVATIREAVRVSGVAAARQGEREDGALSLVRIEAEWTDRENAQALAAYIAARTIELSGTFRSERARETLAFFVQREKELGDRIARVEEETAIFRQENNIAEPVSLEYQQREIETLKSQLLSIDRDVIAARRQLEQIDANGNLTRVERAQLEENTERLNNLIDQRRFIEERLQAASTSTTRDPQVEIQLARFDRELETLAAEKAEVSDRRKQAETMYQLEMSGQSEQFTILEDASWPDYPSTPSRAKLAMLGSVVSVFIALCFAYLLDLRNPVMRSAALMRHELGYGPVVTIPEARPARRRGLFARLLRRGRKTA
ncbi:MAG: DUF874 domain-containing protein [Roseovarius sp.]